MWEEYDTSSRKKKSMKYWQIGQIVYSHFLIENWKVKMLGTITAHVNIEKLNERGKKKTKCKVRAPLGKTSYTPVWGLCFYIYIYIYIYILIVHTKKKNCNVE